jgi:predicted CXXCH cytochrome family protein
MVVSAVIAWTGAKGQPPPNYQGKCSDAGCHDQFAKRAVVHDPVAEEGCDLCHEPSAVGQHQFTFTESGAALCLECHEEHEGKVRHAPAADGECLTCHDPHASDAKGLLQAASLGALCAECHEETTEGLSFLHGPTAVGACTVCHSAHASEYPALLFAEGPAVCMRCHEAMQTRMAEKRHSHDPVQEDCTSCHDAHGAGNNMMLTDTVPALCVECHDDVGELMTDAPVKHDAMTEGKSCSDCHQAHASDVEHLLLTEPMDLCLSCHDKELPSGDGKILNIAALLRENPRHHGPIAQKNCTGCHDVHGSAIFRMLVDEYPEGFYAPFDEKRFTLCFECHEADLVRDERTTTLTNFRNGDWNMHYLHVHRARKGRTCRACHNAHASKRPRHVAETVPFGEWALPINFEQTASGGTCLPGCHRAYGYDRDSAVENVPKP